MSEVQIGYRNGDGEVLQRFRRERETERWYPPAVASRHRGADDGRRAGDGLRPTGETMGRQRTRKLC
jgi:hypothetical protein